ncbi:MAG: Rab family GTPase [Promethearchaeota archaeon]
MVFDKTFKLIIAGDGGVGKTSLTTKFITGLFNPSQKITIGVEFFIKDLELDDLGAIRLQIWDFGGEDRFRFLLPTYVNGANGVLYLFSITDLQTLNNLDDWLEILRGYDAKIPIMMVGSKADLNYMRKVTTHEAVEKAKKLKCRGYVEVSSKSGENIEAAFNTISRLMWKHSKKSD